MANVDIKLDLADRCAALLGAGRPEFQAVDARAFYDLVEVPPNKSLGDFAIPCFRFAKSMKKPPAAVALDFERALSGGLVKGGILSGVKATGPYLNLFLNKEEVARKLIAGAVSASFDRLQSHGKGKTVVIDFSSPNIAKPFGIGHLRSTVIGNALRKIFTFLGYRVIGINHLGDWGTQFGKLITAYKRWGDEAELARDPIRYLFRLYVRFHKEVVQSPELEQEGRSWFSRLEGGDAEAVELWERFRELSLGEFRKIYARLGVEFDHYTGESFYGDKLEKTVRAVVEKGIAEESDGALIVPLDDMPPALIKKSDDATLYLTRDVAAAIYRHDTFQFDLALYVVGTPQALHFRQLFAVLKKMECGWVEQCHHVPFGQIGFEEGAMSTRRGNVIFLEEVLDRACELARRIVEDKNPDLADKGRVAEAVGVGAIIFNDLKNGRIKDITFDWDEVLNFNGETGPYLQYTFARISSLIGKYTAAYGELETQGAGFERLPFGEEGYEVALLVNGFEDVVLRASSEFEPSVISKYLLELASAFNTFYNKHRVLGGDRALSLSRALVVLAVKQVLGAGLGLLGIRAVEEM